MCVWVVSLFGASVPNRSKLLQAHKTHNYTYAHTHTQVNIAAVCSESVLVQNVWYTLFEFTSLAAVVSIGTVLYSQLRCVTTLSSITTPQEAHTRLELGLSWLKQFKDQCYKLVKVHCYLAID